MKVKQLMEALKKMPENAEVEAWDADAEQDLGVTGLLLNHYETVVTIQTDVL